jgi:hypothetical protein
LAEKANGQHKTEYCSACLQLKEALPDGSTAMYKTMSLLFLTTNERPEEQTVEQRVEGLMVIN